MVTKGAMQAAIFRSDDQRRYLDVDVAIIMDHLILEATNQGLGTCWIGGFNEKKIKDILGIPPRIKVVAMTP